MDNSITNIFLLNNNGNQIVKAIKTDGWNAIKSSKPLRDGVVTDITLHITNIPGYHAQFGIVANPDILSLSKNLIGNFPNSWGYSIGNGCLHNFLAGNGPFQCLVYGPNILPGDIFTLRIDLTDNGVL
jgi:hypothetical protein